MSLLPAGMILILLGSLALQGSVRADVEKADSLVGTSVTVKNVYRSSGGVTIAKLRSDKDVEAARRALQAALKKYPASFIARVLNTVYVGSELKWTSNKDRQTDGWCGLYRYQDRTIFIKFDGNAAQFESVFHHELAHGIHFGFHAAFNEAAWLAACPSGFQYTGVADSRPPTPELNQQGFVRPYAMHSLPEDVACLAERLVGDPEGFAKGLGRFERISRKARVLVALYQTVDPVMTVSYFRLQQAAARASDAVAESASDERGRPLLVSAQAERGAFLGNFKEGDRVTLLFRDGDKPRGKSTLTFAPESPANITLCRRRIVRTEPELTVLARVPRLSHERTFTHTFKEDCAAVLKMDGESADGVGKVRFEFQVDRSGRQ